MKPKFGREIALLTLPFLAIGGVAWWKICVDAADSQPQLLQFEWRSVFYDIAPTRIQFATVRRRPIWNSDQDNAPRIEKVWATDGNGRALDFPLDLKSIKQCKPISGPKRRWFFVYELKIKPLTSPPRQIVIHHVLKSANSLPTPYDVVLKHIADY